VIAATSSVGQRPCPRCGTESQGAAWCAACGLNLRLHSVPEPATPPVAAAPVAVCRRRRVVSASAGLVLVLLAVGIAVVFVTRGSGAPKASAPPASAPPASANLGAPAAFPAPIDVAPAAAPISTGEMGQVLQWYADAYTNENVNGLQSLFADNLVRTNGTDPSEDLAQALDTYRSQFAALSNPVYSLSNLGYDVPRATAAAIYSISSDAGTVGGGSIGFHFVRLGNQLLIDAIAIQPSA